MPQGALERIRALDAGRAKPAGGGSLERVRALDAGRKAKPAWEGKSFAPGRDEPLSAIFGGGPEPVPEPGPHLDTGASFREGARRMPGVIAGQTAGSLLDAANIAIERMGGGKLFKPGPRLKALGIADDVPFQQSMRTLVDAVLPPETPEAGQAQNAITRTLEGVASGGAFLLPGMALSKAPRVAQLLSVAGQASTQAFAQTYHEAKGKGADDDTAWNSALLAGGIEGPMELLPLGKMLGRWNKASGGSLGKVLKTAVREGAEESAQELAQQAAADIIAKEMYDEERVLLRNVVQQGQAAGMSGFLLSVLMSAAGVARGRAKSPMAEGQGSIDAQFDALREGRVPGVLVTPGSATPANVEGLQSAEITPDETGDKQGAGTLYYTDPATLDQARSGDLGGALGYGTSKKPETTTQALVVRDAQGRLVRIVAAEETVTPEVQAAAERVAGEGGTVEAVPIGEIAPILQERAGGAEIAMLPEQGGERPPVTESPEFKEWFKASKASDADEKPLVVYHGTKGGFSTFTPSRGGEYGSGIYFSDDPNTAGKYADQARGEGGSSVVPAYISIQNPYYADATTGRNYVRGQGVAKLIRDGYDGIIATGLTGEKQYIVFSPERVKSALSGKTLAASQAAATGGGGVVDEGPVSVQEGPVETSSPGTPIPSQSARGETGEALRDFTLDEPPAKPPPESPSEEPRASEPGGGLQSIKNRVVDETLEAMGLPPAQHGERVTDLERHGRAMAKLKADPFAGKRLVDDLATAQRPPTGDEGALLALEVNRLIVERDAAQESFNAMPTAGNQARVELAVAEYAKAADVVTMAGTESSASLRIRKMMIARDYSLAAMERAKQAANPGEPLTTEQRAEVAEQAKTIADLQKKLDEQIAAAETREAELEADLATARLRKTAKKRKPPEPGAVLKFISAEAEKARARIRARGTRVMAGLDPLDFADRTIVGAEFIAKDIATFVEWSKAMVAEFGETVRPHLDAIFEKAKDAFGTYSRALGVGDTEKKIRERVKAEGYEGPEDLRPLVRKLAEGFVASGVTERDALVNAVHGVLEGAVPGVTRRQTMDLVSGYGDFTPLSKDEVKVRLRELRGELQQVAKLEDMEAGLAPLKTGPERGKPSDEGRRLTKKVNEAKKKLGIRTTDPETQLASALDTRKTTLLHQIADLQHQIDTKAQTIKTRTPGPRDAEVEALEVQRDALRDQFEDIFKGEETARVAAAIKGLEKSIADIAARIDAGALGPKSAQAKPAPSTLELEALRARREALQNELEFLRLADGLTRTGKAKADPEAVAIKARKTRMTNELARLKEKVFYGDYSKKPKREPRAMDAETVTIAADLEQEKRRFAAGLERDRLRNRSKLRKGIDVAKELIVDLPRAVKSAFDLSAPLRQGAILTVDPRYLPATVRNIGRMVKAAASARYALEVDVAIRSRPLAQFGEQSKLELTRADDAIGPQEEAIRSRLSDKIPGIKASNRAFITYLNLQRAHAFDAMVNAIENPTLEEGKAIANAVNVFSGRGNPGQQAASMRAAAYVLWSPRLLLSRIQTLTGQPLYKGTARTRKAIAKQYGASLVGFTALYALAIMAGFEIEDDPRSSDFGKLRDGATRLDPLAGMAQVSVLAARLVTGEKITGSGKTVAIRGKVPFGQDTSADVLARFLRSKFTPTLGAAVDVVSGQNIVGEPVTPGSAALDLVTPLTFGDVAAVMEEQGIPKGTAMTILSIFGMGMQNYEAKKK